MRGYALNVASSTGPVSPRNFAAYGAELHRKLEEYHGSSFHMTMMGEVLGRYENHVRINKDKVDAWGIPTLKINCAYGENERAMLKDMSIAAAEMLAAAGAKEIEPFVETNPPGRTIHEMGTARMGHDHKTSVLNAHNQTWDAKNLFVTDGACMTSSACQNPSITYMALTARACDFAVGRMKRGEI